MAPKDDDYSDLFNDSAPAEPPQKSLSRLGSDDSEEGGFGLFGGDNSESPLFKPWMKFHEFTLVQSVEEVKKIVDEAIEHGRCGLDLETEGFDNRIDYDEQGNPYTKHQIVGYCLSVNGHGYYIPIRHEFDTLYEERNPNVVPAEAVDAEIKRLCLASQPVLTEEEQRTNPLTGMGFETPPQVVIKFWHSKFDQEFLYPITGIDHWHPESFEDGLLAAYVIYSDDKEKDLKSKAAQWLRVPKEKLEAAGMDSKEAVPYEMINFVDLFPKGTPKRERHFKKLYPEKGSNVVLYGCSDAICTELLCECPKILEGMKRYAFTYRLEKQVVQAVRLMERERCKIDKAEVQKVFEEASSELAGYEEKIKALATSRGFKDFNPSSTSQLSDFLFTDKGLNIEPKPKKLEKSGQYQTDTDTLEKWAEKPNAPDVLVWIVRYRQIEKMMGTYLTKLMENTDEHDQLRFNFKQTGAATGRFTAPQGDADHGFAGIPVQGIPGKVDPKKPACVNSIRRVFVAREGYTMAKVDFAGEELRIVANISREPLWTKEFLEGTGDLHTLTAQAFFPGLKKGDADFKLKRGMGKIANFALIYGGGVQAIMRATKCDNIEAARKKGNFDKSVPKFAEWVKSQHRKVKKNEGITTAFHRWIAVPDANVKAGQVLYGRELGEGDAKRIRAACERKSTNYPVQGAAADILKVCLVRLYREFHMRGWLRNGGDDSVRMVMTVHDEIVFEIKDEKVEEILPLICRVMESPPDLTRPRWRIPLIVEPLIGRNWDGKHDWLRILKGEEPLPEWLEDKVDVAKIASDSQTPTETPEAQPVQNSVAKASPKTTKTSSPESPDPVKSTVKSTVVTFALDRNHLTKASVGLVRLAQEAARPQLLEVTENYEDSGCALQLITADGQVLIEPALGAVVSPPHFSRELKRLNLGHTYTISGG
jgi:DNA polymerase I-like protein with 3'-5' exonuclease and polymerase domains